MRPKGFEMIGSDIVSAIARFIGKVTTIGAAIDNRMPPVAGMRVPNPSLFGRQFAPSIAMHKPAAWVANTTT
jgi:hypothetical protein